MVKGKLMRFRTVDDSTIGLTFDRVRKDLVADNRILEYALSLIRTPSRNSLHGRGESNISLSGEQEKIYKVILKIVEDPSTKASIISMKGGSAPIHESERRFTPFGTQPSIGSQLPVSEISRRPAPADPTGGRRIWTGSGLPEAPKSSKPFDDLIDGPSVPKEPMSRLSGMDRSGIPQSFPAGPAKPSYQPESATNRIDAFSSKYAGQYAPAREGSAAAPYGAGPIGGPSTSGKPAGFSYVTQDLNPSVRGRIDGPIDFGSLYNDRTSLETPYMRQQLAMGYGMPSSHPLGSDGYTADVIGEVRMRLKSDELKADIIELCQVLKQDPPVGLQNLRPLQLQPIYDRLLEKLRIESGAMASEGFITTAATFAESKVDGKKTYPLIGDASLKGLGSNISEMFEKPVIKHHAKQFVKETGIAVNSGAVLAISILVEVLNTVHKNKKEKDKKDEKEEMTKKISQASRNKRADQFD